MPASVARRISRGDSAARNKCGPREGGRKLEHAKGAWWLFLLTFLFLFYTIFTSTENGASAVEILLGFPRH